MRSLWLGARTRKVFHAGILIEPHIPELRQYLLFISFISFYSAGLVVLKRRPVQVIFFSLYYTKIYLALIHGKRV